MPGIENVKLVLEGLKSGIEKISDIAQDEAIMAAKKAAPFALEEVKDIDVKEAVELLMVLFSLVKELGEKEVEKEEAVVVSEN